MIPWFLNMYNVLYKRGVHTSEAFTPPTLRTSKAAHLNHIRIK